MVESLCHLIHLLLRSKRPTVHPYLTATRNDRRPEILSCHRRPVQRRGVDEVRQALADESVSLILVQRDHADPVIEELIEEARKRGIPVEEGSESDIWRMAIPGPEAAKILALVGRQAEASIEELLGGDGVVWLLVGVRFAVNIGYVIRTAEITGAAGLIICGEFSKTEQRTALRASMKSNRFIPVLWTTAKEALTKIGESERRLVSVEDVGDISPWDADLVGNPVICVGGEHDGVPQQVLDQSEQIIRLPMAGFVPSYNLQTAMGVVALEAMRQNGLGE